MTDRLIAMNNTHKTPKESLALLGANYLDDNSVKSGNKAWVAPLTYDSDGNPIIVLDERKYDSDIYELLDNAGRKIADKHDELVIYTCGWAAPISEDDDDFVPPSEHPLRIRVGLLVLATKSGLTASAMRKADDDELIIAGDEAQGLLAETVLGLWG